jgi:hypothetical protein
VTHIYTPLSWQRSLGYSESLTLRNGKPQCRAAVHEGGRMVGFHQCQKAGHVEVDGVWLCKIHDPAAVAARRAASDAKYAKQSEKWRVEWAGAKFRQALQAIADGHNDPRACAMEALGDLYVKPDSEAQS